MAYYYRQSGSWAKGADVWIIHPEHGVVNHGLFFLKDRAVDFIERYGAIDEKFLKNHFAGNEVDG